MKAESGKKMQGSLPLLERLCWHLHLQPVSAPDPQRASRVLIHHTKPHPSIHPEGGLHDDWIQDANIHETYIQNIIKHIIQNIHGGVDLPSRTTHIAVQLWTSRPYSLHLRHPISTGSATEDTISNVAEYTSLKWIQKKWQRRKHCFKPLHGVVHGVPAVHLKPPLNPRADRIL